MGFVKTPAAEQLKNVFALCKSAIFSPAIGGFLGGFGSLCGAFFFESGSVGHTV